MIRTLYGDVLLLIDFCMNVFVLYITGAILHRKTRAICLSAAALLGGIYDLAKLYVNGNDLMDCVISIAVGLLMCYITYGGYRFIRTALVFFGAAAVAGGSMIGVYYLLGSYHADLFGGIGGYAYSHIPLWLFAALAAISFLLTKILSVVGRDTDEHREKQLLITYAENTAEFSVLLDSGNLLREPISGKPVILLSRNSAARLLPKKILCALDRNDSEYLLRRRFRLIAVQGVDGKRQIGYAFLPKKIKYADANTEPGPDVYLAVCGNAAFANTDGVMHPSCL